MISVSYTHLDVYKRQEGLHTKLNKMPPEAREKVQQTLEKIINEGSGGLICIIL